jgi:hypothetical protein
MALLQKFWCFAEDLAEKRHNLAADDLRVAISNTAPDAATGTTLGSISEIAAGNGYPSGGLPASIMSSAQVAGTYKLVLGDVVLTAAGGPVGPFRYFILRNATSDRVIGWADLGVSLTIANGETFTWDADPDTGVLQIA